MPEFDRNKYLLHRNCPLQVGKKYRRYNGVIVTIIGNNDNQYPNFKGWPKYYEAVQGDDVYSYYDPETGVLGESNIWRYNRGGNDAGRVCGSPHDMSYHRNLHLEPVEE